MLLKSLIYEDFVNYKKPSMFIGCHSCTFKCDKLAGKQVCQNGTLANSPSIDVPIEKLVKRYIENPYTEAVVFGGLEPFDDIINVISFITLLRTYCDDEVIIYTGYTQEEVTIEYLPYFVQLKSLKNIIIKFGRFIPNEKPHLDRTLGIPLQSSNQYAVRIS